MSDPYLGEVRMFANPQQLPSGWALCDGSILSIDSNQALYSLLGNNFGGDNTSTFALPNLIGTVPIHIGNGQFDADIGTQIGSPSCMLSADQMPAHTHNLMASAITGSVNSPLGNLLASFDNGFGAYTAGSTTTLSPSTVAPTGGGVAHENRQPYLCINFMICMQGVYPS